MKKIILPIAALLVAGAVSAGEPTVVALFKDRFHPPERVASAKLRELPDVTASWSWSDDTPAQRSDEKVTPGVLEVRIERGSGVARSLTLLFGPELMWEEVPEELMPSRKVELEKKPVTVRIPVDTSRECRIRLTAANAGTWWTDIPPARHQVTIPLVAATDRAIQMRNEDGTPLPRTKLSVLDAGAQRGNFRKLGDYRSDDKGHIVLPSVPEGTLVTLVFSAADRAPHVIETKPAQIPSIVTLRNGHKVIGRVTTAKGEPIANVLVAVQTWMSDLLPIPLTRDTRSDANGYWELGALPIGKGEWSASKRGFADVTQPVDTHPDILDIGTVTLSPATLLDVLIVDDRGEPVDKAAIANGPRILATTNAKGHAQIALKENQAIDVRVTAPHYRMLTTTIDAASTQLTKLVLRRAFRVTGRLVDASGTPVSGGRTRAHNGSRHEMGQMEPDGTFDVDLEPDNDYDLELLSPRTAAAKLTIAKGTPGEIRALGDVVAPAALTIAGRLVRDSDASPVAGARVWLPRPSQDGPLMSWAFRDLLETTSAADGTFEVTGVPKVSVTLRIEAASLAPARLAVTPAADKDRTDVGDIRLSGGATVLIHLQGARGDDVVGRVDTGGMGLSFDSLRAPVVDGTARVTNVPPGQVVVSAWRGRNMLCRHDAEVPNGGGDVDVVCSSHKVAIVGTVKVGGHPAGPGTLIWSTPAPKDIATGIITYGSGAAQQQQVFSPERPQESVEVGYDGRFDGPSLLVGDWEVMWMPERGRAFASKPVTVTDTAVQTVTLEYPGVAIDGVVLDANRKPVKDADVRDVGHQGFARTRDDGTFTLAGPEPGTWRVQASYFGQFSDVKEVVVEDRPERPRVELVLGADPSRVRVVAGRGALVFLEHDTGRLELASSDDSGVATFHIEQPPPARVRVAINANGRWALGDWIGWADAMKAPIEVATADTGNIVVRTKGASGLVTVTSMNGWRIDRLFQWVGAFLRLATGSEVTVAGIPAGTYTLGVASQQRTASVETDKTGEVVFD